MLLSFSLSNWMSFSGTTSFSMIAGRERQHGERVTKLSKYQTRILPIAAIYGGNASGKTNLFKAMSFLKKFVLYGRPPEAPIPLEPFRLAPKSDKQPVQFNVVIYSNGFIYDLTLEMTRAAVLEEKLVKISSGHEETLYHRTGDTVEFSSKLQEDTFLNFAFKGTRSNQLFLTNSIYQKIDHFRPIYNWFSNQLELIGPDSRFEDFDLFIDENHSQYPAMNLILAQLDTGILHLAGVEVPLKGLNLPESFMEKVTETLRVGKTVKLLADFFGHRYLITNREGELIAKKLVSYHSNAAGETTTFEMDQESDGTQRVIDLLPAFMELANPDAEKVFLIDELDRSLHTLLTRKLIEGYLSGCSNESRKQLIFTTHDVLLMDQELFRRDEMWVAERSREGISKLFSFSDYQGVRYDKDIRKSYLQGRLGGIPRLLPNT